MEMTRERISFTFGPRDMLSSLQKGFSFERAAVAYAPGRVALSVGHLTRKSEVLDSIPGLATYFRQFLLPLIQEGQLSVTGEGMCTKYWLTA